MCGFIFLLQESRLENTLKSVTLFCFDLAILMLKLGLNLGLCRSFFHDYFN
jgi:hypothetical protein